MDSQWRGKPGGHDEAPIRPCLTATSKGWHKREESTVRQDHRMSISENPEEKRVSRGSESRRTVRNGAHLKRRGGFKWGAQAGRGRGMGINCKKNGLRDPIARTAARIKTASNVLENQRLL